ncbi:HP0268 family nuclease [uncultured Campylobacter sp.]|uniref:HP0268 family nuclease n=1 Tax=uncultured Campylobacter sp. TaxID=218934 RepID=UPI002602494F|nr:HP0268 family nuclease [uncultured Campylobacter sp.]
MVFKLAKKELSSKSESISIEQIEEGVTKKGHKIFYLDKENSNKELKALIEYFEKKGYTVYPNTVKYGLDDGDYMYEVHIFE